VPNPEVALDEFARVLKPVGEIVRLNRVGADAGPAACVRASVSAEMKVITDSPHDVQTLERPKGRIRGDEVCIFDNGLGAQQPVKVVAVA
jgi:hypothetical protein